MSYGQLIICKLYLRNTLAFIFLYTLVYLNSFRREFKISIVYINDEYLHLIDAQIFNTESSEVRDGVFGLCISDLGQYVNRGQATAIAQFYKLVIPGLILTRHIFRGLERPLRCDDNMKGDESKLIYTRKPVRDYIWTGGVQGGAQESSAPMGCVFNVIISPNIKHKEKYPEVDGWVERWYWVEEDSGLPEAPSNWVDRFKEKLYTRKEGM